MKKYTNHILLHFIVLLWGTTGVLGKLIQENAYALVWHRFILAILAMAVWLKFKRISIRISQRDLWQLLGVGGIIALHWIAFFGAIQIANISVTLVCLSSGSLFAAFLEPLFFKRHIHMHEILFGLSLIFGIALIFTITPQFQLGMGIAIFSAFASSLFLVLNGILIRKHNAVVMSFYEMLGGFLVLSVLACVLGMTQTVFILPTPQDFGWLLILAVVCTAFAFVVSVQVMKVIKPFDVVLAVGMEPVYGILLAYFVFADSERMRPQFYWGAGIVLATIYANVLVKRRMKG